SQRPEPADDAQPKFQPFRHAGWTTVVGASSNAALSSGTSRLCGAIAAVLAVTVETLASVMKVSETVSTATNSTKAASKGRLRQPEWLDICDRATRPAMPVVVREGSDGENPNSARSTADRARP